MIQYKKTLFAFAIALFTAQSCQGQKTVINREVETAGGKMLLGTQSKDQLLKEPYSQWYNSEHDSYQLDQKTITDLKKEKLNAYNITLVLGTWCGDSHREVPRLMKILEALNYPEAKLQMIAVNRKYEAPGGEESKYNIQRVPTIIVSRYGKEVGRIVEHPATGYLERDLLDILKKDRSSLTDILK
ncbi:thioredoxin family protein [Chryseobacterium salipaludis]|uniref:TlpA family protein disulfide reductase n=1 Tax=Chryseobacterium TaxID=59732 RepID=UPI001FF3A2EE|nr:MULTISPECIES: thioredoxin family protein [Chryseobacterium]MCJ8496732.1 thioredoxin family protein [Chryseobacterium salipaludis]MCX3296213.1 thioredoxin family protein [Planobacterium sp. JC490]